MSVLRLRSDSREELLDACVHVIDAWRGWTDESVGVIAHDADGTPHNTVTPVVRRVDSEGHTGGPTYEAFLALRCNVASAEHPLGVFHPHEQWHHIKKENIGLIEVMGLAILPPRLVSELGAVREHLLAGELDALESDRSYYAINIPVTADNYKDFMDATVTYADASKQLDESKSPKKKVWLSVYNSADNFLNATYVPLLKKYQEFLNLDVEYVSGDGQNESNITNRLGNPGEYDAFAINMVKTDNAASYTSVLSQ